MPVVHLLYGYEVDNAVVFLGRYSVERAIGIE
jgi:hypothetical protein